MGFYSRLLIEHVQRTSDIWTGQDSKKRWLAATLSQKFQHLVVYLFGVGQVHSLQRVREEMVEDGGSVGWSQLFVPAHSFQKDLLVSEAQEIS